MPNVNSNNQGPDFLWRIEHPKAEIPAALTNDPELLDISWHNDICPSFTTQALLDTEIRLWADYAAADHREYPEVKRFRVCDNDGDILFESETDIEGAIAFLKAVTL